MKRYYEKNREKRLAEMRERARVRVALLREQIANDPEKAQEARDRAQDKYQRGLIAKQTRLIAEWEADNGICPIFKEFLKTNVKPVLPNGIPMKFFKMCFSHLAIVNNT